MNKIPERFMNGKNGRFTPVIVFDYTFLQILLENMDGLREDLETLRVIMRDAAHYSWDNSHFRFSNIYGDEFSFQINKNFIVFWDVTGGTQLGNFEVNGNARQVTNKIHEISKHYSIGEKRCSGCGKWTPRHESDKHRYFASTFCTDCWENKWKAIEAKENYE